jgi:hypothetical protein
MNDLGEVVAINIACLEEGGRFRFLLREGGANTQPSVAFEMRADLAMGLLSALREYQAKYKIPIPASFRPKRGQPPLTIVGDEA